jgi:hypothetical protein
MWAISRKAIARWRSEGRITADQLSLANAVRRLCWWHLAHLLDDLAPGSLRGIIGDAYRDGRDTKPAKGLAILAAMRAAGLILKRKPDRPNPLQQCIATSKRTGQRCQAWRHPGSTVCIWHGALGDPKLRPPKKVLEAKRLARHQRWVERLRRRESGLLPTSVSFAPTQKQPAETAMEAEFRSGRKRPGS